MQRKRYSLNLKSLKNKLIWNKTLKRLIQIQVYPSVCSIMIELSIFTVLHTQVLDAESVLKLGILNRSAKLLIFTKSRIRTS